MKLEPDESYIAFYNGDRKPDLIRIGGEEEPIDLMKLVFILNTGVVKGTPRWS